MIRATPVDLLTESRLWTLRIGWIGFAFAPDEASGHRASGR